VEQETHQAHHLVKEIMVVVVQIYLQNQQEEVVDLEQLEEIQVDQLVVMVVQVQLLQ